MLGRWHPALYLQDAEFFFTTLFLLNGQQDLKSWSSSNFLEFNNKTTKFIPTGSPLTICRVNSFPFFFENSFIIPSTQVKSLCVSLCVMCNSTLSFQPHLNVIKSTHCHLSSIHCLWVTLLDTPQLYQFTVQSHHILTSVIFFAFTYKSMVPN